MYFSNFSLFSLFLLISYFSALLSYDWQKNCTYFCCAMWFCKKVQCNKLIYMYVMKWLPQSGYLCTLPQVVTLFVCVSGENK